MGAGAGISTIGLFLLHLGSTSLAPVLIVAGYCVLVPLGIEWGSRPKPRDGAGPRTTRPAPQGGGE